MYNYLGICHVLENWKCLALQRKAEIIEAYMPLTIQSKATLPSL